MTTTEPPRADLRVPLGRLGPWMASIWLFFLIDPLHEAWQHRDSVGGIVGMLLTVVFAAVYLGTWVILRVDRARLVSSPPLRTAIGLWVLLVALATAMVITIGEHGLASVVYCAVAGVMLFRTRVALVLALTLSVGVILVGSARGWGSQLGLVFSVLAASMAVFGVRSMMSRNIELIRAHQTNAELAVENERGRFARDLHDILGHSLTVITVKAELADKLFDVDPGRARQEVRDLERLSRDALADVRRAVEGYRDLTLPGEIARAKSSLAAAEILADLPNTVDGVPSEVRELFAWTVREGVTNVIRHSGASTCRVTLTASSVRIADDGKGPDVSSAGSGLNGLRERANAANATLITRDGDPGFVLEVITR